MSLPINSKKVFEGVIFDVYQWEETLFDGSVTIFEAVKRKDSVQIIAIFNNQLVLLEEEQPFIGKFLALSGGVCETNVPEDDARRELLEETGFICDSLEFWKKNSYSSKVVWNNHYFIARNCEKISVPCLDSGERIKLLFVSFDEFIKKVLSDDFRNKDFARMILKMHYDGLLDEFREFLFNS